MLPRRSFSVSMSTLIQLVKGVGRHRDLHCQLSHRGYFIALLRYQLYDSDLIVSRSAAYAVLTVAASAMFIGGEALITTTLRADAASEPAEKTLVALAALGLVAPLRSAVMEWADRRFRQPLTQLRDGLPASLAELRDIASIDELIDESAERTRKALQPAQLAFILDGQVWPRRAAAKAQSRIA